MCARDPITCLPTHQVTNQPPPLGDYQAFDTDRVLREAVVREGASWTSEYLRELGAVTGSEHAMEQGFLANREPPQLFSFDRYGGRIDEVHYHPAYHELMRLAVR
ncbi:MAG: DNA alkylation response protein, partial [Nitrococcus sp.]|nr:DNA alkylation response protein [Nitrococcus sp.]